MRRRIAWLVLATSSAIVLSFVIPLGLLVRTMAEDRAMANANQEARNVALLVSRLRTDPKLGVLVDAVDERSPARTSVLTADGQLLGADDPAGLTDPLVARARRGEAFTAIGGDGAEILVPVVTERGTDVVRTTVGDADLHRGVTTAWLIIAGLGVILLVAAAAVAERFGRRLSEPVVEVAGVAHRLREGELDARATPNGPPETVELGIALNRLAERITELLAAERAAVGDLSHRLRTPVTALRLDVEAVSSPELAERLRVHIGQLQRTIDAIVKEARRPVRNNMTTSCDATATVAERVAFWSALAEDQGRRFDATLPGSASPVAVDPADLRDVVDVLVDNVFAHTPEGTAFAVRLDRLADQPGVTALDGRLVLTVSDEGPGMDNTSTGDRPGHTGLGLQIVRRTVAEFGGQVRVDTAPGRGTRVEVTLPGSRVPRTAGRHAQSSPGSGGSGASYSSG